MEVWLFLAALLLVPLALITRTSFVFLKQVRQAPPWRLALGSFLHLQPSLLRPPPSPALSSTDNVSFLESHPHHSCSPSTCSAFFLSIEFISISGHIQIIFFKYLSPSMRRKASRDSFQCYMHQAYSNNWHIVGLQIHWRRKWQPTPVFLPRNPMDRV